MTSKTRLREDPLNPELTEKPQPGDEPEDKSTKSFLGHLKDLRNTIFICMAAFVVGVVIAIPLVPYVRQALLYPLSVAALDPPVPLVLMHPFGAMGLAMRISLWTGLIISIPAILLAVAGFVFPGLTEREKKAVRNGTGFAVILFIAGVLMGYFMTLPIVFRVMVSMSHWLGSQYKFWEETAYMASVLKILLAFGLAFELPVVVLVLGIAGIVNSRQLRIVRRHVIVGLLVMAMLMTPSDPYTMILMATPMILLYEACIWILWARERRRRPHASP